jgi:hypothetical protein
MHVTPRRLHQRGRDSCGITVDPDGATVGPDYPLVLRTQAGFRPIARAEARALQAAVLVPGYPVDWLFEQCRRIADALSRGELALAQIYGLYIPICEFDEAAPDRPAAAARATKANFNPDQPRVPAGEPAGGEWIGEPGDANQGDGDRQPVTGSSGGGAGHQLPVGAGGDGPASNGPPMEYRLPIPAERLATAKDRYAVVRRTAEWLRRAAAFGALAAPEPRVKAALLAIEGTAWLVEYLPEIRSYYLNGPKSLTELQDAVDDPQPGYEIHHIVEGQYRSSNPDRNSVRFADRIESRENLVRIPKWSHVEVSTWYSTRNEEYGGLAPRDYLRGKSWNVQYDVGIKKLRDFGVLQ